MDFVALHYTGIKDYRDRTPLKNLWQPGDVKLVAERDAKRLLQFAEFARHVGKTTPEQEQQAARRLVRRNRTGDEQQTFRA